MIRLLTFRAALAALTPREYEVLFWLCRGLTGKQIARRIGCTSRTVECHCRRIRVKTGITTAPELEHLRVVNAMHLDFVTPL